MHENRSIVALRLMVLAAAVLAGPAAAQSDPNDPGILEPALSATTGQEVRIPNTDQADGGGLRNVVGPIVANDADGAMSLTGNVIAHVESPNRDMNDRLKDLADAADAGDGAAMIVAANDLLALGSNAELIVSWQEICLHLGRFYSDIRLHEHSIFLCL